MTENLDPLDLLLLAAAEDLEEIQKEPRTLKETNLFEHETNVPISKKCSTKNGLIHSGDTDSSEDEDSRNWEERKYTENGRDLKKLLVSASSSNTNVGSSGSDFKRTSRVSNWKKLSESSLEKEKILSRINPTKSFRKPTESTIKCDVYTDPIFGLRIINPLVSSSVLQDRMMGREAVTFNRLNRFLQIKTKDKDWVLAGVVVNKTNPKTSQKGNQFSVWTISDLKDDIKTVAVFLFSGAHQQLWKTSVGTVVGLLNPNVLEKKDGKDEASLSIDNAQKIMVFGQSKDFGTCRSLKKNGDKCMAIVNINRCEYCVYHIKQEYQKCSIRSDLQSTFGGRGLTALRNKVLGKNEVFYAGKSYTAIPAKKSRKLEIKDSSRLNNLSGKGTIQKKAVSGVKKKSAPRLEVSHAQRIKDLNLLEKLNASLDLSEKTSFEGKQSTEISLEDAKNLAVSVLSKLKSKKNEDKMTSNKNEKIPKINSPETLNKDVTNPVLEKLKVNEVNSLKSDHQKDLENKNPKVDNSKLKVTDPFSGPKYTFPKLSGFDSGLIDLNKTITPSRITKAKLNAIKVIQKKGPIKKADPNNLRGTGIKRPLDIEGEKDSEAKKIKPETNSFVSERFKKIMAAASNHQDLLEARDEEEKDKYFFKLEAKEKMEEKMIGTHKLACKAVKCLQCKYTSFSASDLCKSERHPLKVFDAVKRFYKCGNCQNRTVCLEVVPLKACTNCGSSKWEKTGMMKEKLVTATHSLSIRGGEQSNLNSCVTNSSVDLLVPD